MKIFSGDYVFVNPLELVASGACVEQKNVNPPAIERQSVVLFSEVARDPKKHMKSVVLLFVALLFCRSIVGVALNTVALKSVALNTVALLKCRSKYCRSIKVSLY